MPKYVNFQVHIHTNTSRISMSTKCQKQNEEKFN